MTMMTDEQIVKEFKRQVRLCSGIGQAKMLEVVREFYESTLRGKCSCKIGLLPCQIHDWNMDANYK